MIERVSLKSSAKKQGGLYFPTKKDVEFFSTGCNLLDQALGKRTGGGWAKNRIINIIGDKSTGKTGLAIEACANFARKYPKAIIRYRESESAFDELYSEILGMPLDRIDFGDKPLETVEDLFEDLEFAIKNNKEEELYICDSLDALSDRAEMGRDMDAGSYGAEKAKKLSQMFRRCVRDMSNKRITLIIISQIRDKINVTFGRKTTRSGGHALDFYASQIIYLSQISTLSKTIKGIKRPVGILVKAKVDKNKAGVPFREVEFPIIFNYGIDNQRANLNWLKSMDVTPPDENLDDFVREQWWQIEDSFLPQKRRYI